MKTKKHLKKYRGVTLIELLVAISIVAVLVSLGYLGMSRAKQSSKAAANIANLKGIGVAAALWSEDNGSRFMPCWQNAGGENMSWAQVLDPYVHNEDDYRKADSVFIGPNARLRWKENAYGHPITYSCNPAVCRAYNTEEDLQRGLIHHTQVQRASQVILLVDGCQNTSNLNQANASAYKVMDSLGWQKSGPEDQYDDLIAVGPDEDSNKGDGWIRYTNGKAGALMCDGSARLFKKGTITKGNIWIDVDRD